ncbi:hypothetical protein ES707_09951 [subsurface metagenome]
MPQCLEQPSLRRPAPKVLGRYCEQIVRSRSLIRRVWCVQGHGPRRTPAPIRSAPTMWRFTS